MFHYKKFKNRYGGTLLSILAMNIYTKLDIYHSNPEIGSRNFVYGQVVNEISMIKLIQDESDHMNEFCGNKNLYPCD